MKIFKFLLALFAISVSTIACTNEESVTIDKTNAIQEFGIAFNNKAKNFSRTRAEVDNVPDEDLATAMTNAGDKVCNDLIAPSEKLLTEWNFTDKELKEAIAESANEGVTIQITLKELKCYVALTLYDDFLKYNTNTRANALDVALCASTGYGFGSLMNMPAKAIAKCAIKNLFKRFIPGIGIEWGIASAAYCIYNL